MSFRYWDMLELENNEMVFACRKGLSSFNGSEWNLHVLPDFPITIAKGGNGIVYTGLQGDFGTISRDSSGTFRFSSLMPETTGKPDVYSEILTTKDQVFIMGTASFYVLDSSGNIKHESYQKKPYLQGFMIQNDKLHILDNNQWYVYDNDTFIPKNHKGLATNTEIIFQTQDSNGLPIIGTSNNKIYRFDGNNFNQLNLEDQDYLDQTIIIDGVMVDENTLSIATSAGGILLINSNNGENIHTINYTTGLPDDETYDMFRDSQGGLWISHGRGISRIDFTIPIRTYNNYPGLNGNLLTFALHQGEKYVGTSTGLYYLTKVKSYKTQNIRVKVKPKPQKQDKETKEATEIEPVDKKKKGKLKRFFRKIGKKVAKPIKKITQSKEAQKKEKEKKTQSVFTTKTIYKLQSITHAFKQVENFNNNCFQLQSFKDMLLGASNTGLYIISNHKAEPILRNVYVNYFTPSEYQKDALLVATNRGLYRVTYQNGKWKSNMLQAINDDIQTITESSKDEIWLGGVGNAYKLNLNNDQASLRTYQFNTHMLDEIKVRKMDKKLNFLLASEIYKYDTQEDTIVPDPDVDYQSSFDLQAFYQQPDYTWLRTNDWQLYKPAGKFNLPASKYLPLFDQLENIIIDHSNNIWIIDRENNLHQISSNQDTLFIPEFILNIHSIKHKGDAFVEPGDIELSYSNNALYIQVSSPFYLKNNAVEYQYKLIGLTRDWTQWSQNAEIHFPFIPPGDYVLLLKSKTILGNTSKTVKIPVTIKKPFTQTALFFMLVGIGVILLILLIIRLRLRKLRQDKIILEKKVKERTKTITEQNEEITAQRDDLAERNEEILQQKEEITAQRDEIEKQKDQIQGQHDNIRKSIHYAERIQSAILAKEEQIKSWLNDYFILFKPRDIVSGDFYWINKLDNKVIVVAADCTGHGVPGAFMSMLGVAFLNEITADKANLHANMILNRLRDYVKNTLSQRGKENEAKDGMDISLMVFDFDAQKAEFAGAFNSLYMIRNGELSEVKADKMPVGIYLKEQESFTNHEIDIQKGDTFYMLSDGYPDQFGGPKNRKFMRKPFKRMLLGMQNQPMEQQKEILDRTFQEWLANTYEQTDDVLVIGVRI